ncbi:MAG: AMP-binding protein [Psychrobium sp.]
MKQPSSNLSLLEALSQREQDQKLLSDGQRWWTVAQVIAAACDKRNQYSQLLGQAVILSALNPAEFVIWLCALDGFVNELILAADSDLTNLGSFKASGYSLITEPNVELKNITLPQENCATSWRLLTSGTTAKPKLISHTLKGLSASVTNPSTDYRLRWGLLYQPSRFAGLQVILQALLGNGELVVSNCAVIQQRIANFSTLKVNALSATPSFWRKILMTSDHNRLSLSHITLGGEIADNAVLNQLSRSFPRARVRHIYASTDAGVGFSVNDGKSGFPISFLKEDKLEVRNGMLWMRASSMLESPMVNTGDLVAIEDERVYFLGREQGVINVGGNKVFPETVEIKIRQFDEINDVRVFAKENPIMGQLVAADIVPAVAVSDEALFKQQLIAKMRKLLPVHEVPMLLFLKKEIALSNHAKVARN